MMKFSVKKKFTVIKLLLAAVLVPFITSCEALPDFGKDKTKDPDEKFDFVKRNNSERYKEPDEKLPENVNVDYDAKPVVRGGMDAGTAEKELVEVLKQREFSIRIDLGAGSACHNVWTSDISYEYVKINADYHT